jgi:predicted nucleic acid-binding protein
MPTGKKIFIDTNILLYANIANSPFHQGARHALRTAPNSYDSLWINRQVIREYLKVMSLEMKNAGKVDYPMLQQEITDYLQIL